MNKRTFIKAGAAAVAVAAIPSAVAGAMPAIKVFRLNDYEWWAAASLTDAIADWKEWTGLTDEELEQPRELSAEEMQRLTYVEVDDDMRRSTFAEELAERVKAGLKFPQPFATTEY